MTLKNRMKRLEACAGSEAELPEFVCYQIVGFKEGTREIERRPGPVRIIGTDIGNIWPEEGETEEQFERRIYAIKAGGKLIEDMTHEEAQQAFGIADERLREEA